MKRTLWIVSGGAEAVPGITRAREMGLHVVVSDMNPSAPGFAAADDSVIANTYDVDETVAAAAAYHRKTRPIDGVMCMAADVPLTVASVAAALDLPGIPVESARLAADKLAMKQAFANAGIPIPWYRAIASLDELRAAVGERGVPLVLKPVDGSRRARRAAADGGHRPGMGVRACDQPVAARRRDGRGSIWPGRRSAPRGCSSTARARPAASSTATTSTLDTFAPYIVENGGEQPSALPPEAQERISAVAMDAGRAIGIVSGSVKGDMVWTDRGPCVIEIAARLSGGWMSTDQIPLGTGVDLIACAIRLALGERVPAEDLRPRRHRGVAIRYFFPPPGRVTAIGGADAFRDVPWVHRMGFFVEPGDVVQPTTDHTKRAGFVITTGATREEAVSRAESVVQAVRIQTT